LNKIIYIISYFWTAWG